MIEWQKRKKAIDNGKDTILPSFATANRYTPLSNYNVVSSNNNGISFPVDCGTLCIDYNLETIL
jgi:hypothetical protein